MKCPNCGKELNETFFTDKCPYCRFLLKKKEHPFDRDIYDFLKNDYLETRNKADSIKNGMARFGISTGEAKEILDFIADEVYEEENYRPSDEINDNGKYDLKIFKFSFLQYFFRNMIYKIFFLVLLFLAGKYVAGLELEYDTRMPLLFGILGVGIISLMIFLFQWAIASTRKVIAESGTINYVYRTPVGATGKELDRMSTEEVWGMRHNHYIEIVKEVTERPNHIVVRGSIKSQNSKYHHLGTTNYSKYALSKVKIPKYFKHNRELLQVLYDYKR